jgi:hypothetical protein
VLGGVDPRDVPKGQLAAGGGFLKPSPGRADHGGVRSSPQSVPDGTESYRATRSGRVVRVHAAVSEWGDASAALARVREALPAASGLTLVTVPVGYDLDEVAAGLRAWPNGPVIACTSAGGIGPGGYAPDALVGIALHGGGVRARTITIGPLDDLDQAMVTAGPQIEQGLALWGRESTFALLLVDGLCLREESLAHALTPYLGDVPLIGGSAGDDLRFERTAVYADGAFASGSATLTLVHTAAAWRRFRVQHHTAGHAVAVVTGADPDHRLVYTLNGRRAVTEYAALVGVGEDLLTPTVFSTHPLVLRAGGGEWVRSISRPEPDRSLRFFCAAEPGDVLRLGQAGDPVQALTAAFTDLERDLGTLSGALVFDCILRRLEFDDLGINDQVSALLSRHHAAGFSTFGEQYDGVHVNQTMVGIAFGG